MGTTQCNCGSRRKEIPTSFDQFEEAKLKKIYERLIKKSSNPNMGLTERNIEDLFPENRKFAHKAYKWMQMNSENGIIDYNVFLASVEVFVKENLDFYLVKYHIRPFQKVEIMALISLEFDLKNKNEFEKLTISYSQALLFVSEIINIFFVKQGNKLQCDDIGAKVVTNYIYGSQYLLDFIVFIERLKHQFVNVNKLIRDYFYSKFLDKSYYFRLPVLSKPSFILNQQLISIFYLSNATISNYDKLVPLYANAASSYNFDNLASALLSYTGKTLILFKCLDASDSSSYSLDSTSVFGFFCSTAWYPDPEISGDENSYIFSLIPKFRNFFTKYGEGGRLFASLYYNSKNNANGSASRGIGIGGYENQGFRVWIDENLNNCYLNNEDKTYEGGYVLEKGEGKVKIEFIEVWGLENEGAFAGVETMRHAGMMNAEINRSEDKPVCSSTVQSVENMKRMTNRDRVTHSYRNNNEMLDKRSSDSHERMNQYPNIYTSSVTRRDLNISQPIIRDSEIRVERNDLNVSQHNLGRSLSRQRNLEQNITANLPKRTYETILLDEEKPKRSAKNLNVNFNEGDKKTFLLEEGLSAGRFNADLSQRIPKNSNGLNPSQNNIGSFGRENNLEFVRKTNDPIFIQDNFALESLNLDDKIKRSSALPYTKNAAIYSTATERKTFDAYNSSGGLNGNFGNYSNFGGISTETERIKRGGAGGSFKSNTAMEARSFEPLSRTHNISYNGDFESFKRTPNFGNISSNTLTTYGGNSEKVDSIISQIKARRKIY